MKYCIGCKHLCYQPKVMGYGSEWTGSWTREDAAIACGKGHWETHVTEGPFGFDFAKAMETAETCPDFEERPTPT